LQKSLRRSGRMPWSRMTGRSRGQNGGVRGVRNVEWTELDYISKLTGIDCGNKMIADIGRCFCGRVTSPSTNLTLPHSCAEPCWRPRPLCSHPCTLPCHPGPCPPCQVALIVPCPSHHSSLTVKCAAATAGANMTPVCDEVCGKERGCGDRSHVCQVRPFRSFDQKRS
jgi:hypothetical protein